MHNHSATRSSAAPSSCNRTPANIRMPSTKSIPSACCRCNSFQWFSACSSRSRSTSTHLPLSNASPSVLASSSRHSASVRHGHPATGRPRNPAIDQSPVNLLDGPRCERRLVGGGAFASTTSLARGRRPRPPRAVVFRLGSGELDESTRPVVKTAPWSPRAREPGHWLRQPAVPALAVRRASPCPAHQHHAASASGRCCGRARWTVDA